MQADTLKFGIALVTSKNVKRNDRILLDMGDQFWHVVRMYNMWTSKKTQARFAHIKH